MEIDSLVHVSRERFGMQPRYLQAPRHMAGELSEYRFGGGLTTHLLKSQLSADIRWNARWGELMTLFLPLRGHGGMYWGEHSVQWRRRHGMEELPLICVAGARAEDIAAHIGHGPLVSLTIVCPHATLHELLTPPSGRSEFSLRAQPGGPRVLMLPASLALRLEWLAGEQAPTPLRMQQMSCELLDWAVGRLAGHAPRGSTRQAILLEQARSLLGEAGDAMPDQATLCQRLGVSPRTLQRLFRTQGAGDYRAFTRGLRLEHARHLLCHTDLPVKRIAHSTGYRDASAFSRAFRQHFGVAPGTLRGPVRQEDAPVRMN